MTKKILIVGFIICAFFIASSCPAMAADETKTIYDGTGDVIDDTGKAVPGITDIDFDKITYEKEDTQITVEIEFVGIIQKANLIFQFSLVTTDNEYQIIYFNYGGYEDQYGTVLTDDDEIEMDFTLTGYGTHKLTIKFELLDDNEDYDSIIVNTAKVDLETENEYIDSYPNILTLNVSINGPSTGKVGESIQFYSEVTGGTEPFDWEWYINDNVDVPDSTQQNPKFTFDEPGEYDILVQVTDYYENIGFNVTTITITSGSSNGNNSGNNDNSPIILFVALIIIIVIIGIAVLVFVIKR